tara:strand:- start:712 stop:852 length:141 start_codon:yes stop_codon:yes gene_type:complete
MLELWQRANIQSLLSPNAIAAYFITLFISADISKYQVHLLPPVTDY